MIKSTSLIGVASLLASAASAASSDSGQCRAITDPAQRLACYDRAADRVTPPVEAGRAPVAPASPAAVLPSSSAPRQSHAAQQSREDRKARTSGRIAAASPLRHGYFRLELEDGAAYETTVVGPPPPVGEEVHIRRTLLGTTFFDIKGWSPITVRPTRQ